jgi:hypothetical protein
VPLFVSEWCRPAEAGPACATMMAPRGPFPRLTARRGDRIVADAGLDAASVQVTATDPSTGRDRAALRTTQVDARRWAFTAPRRSAHLRVLGASAAGGGATALGRLRVRRR